MVQVLRQELYALLDKILVIVAFLNGFGTLLKEKYVSVLILLSLADRVDDIILFSLSYKLLKISHALVFVNMVVSAQMEYAFVHLDTLEPTVKIKQVL